MYLIDLTVSNAFVHRGHFTLLSAHRKVIRRCHYEVTHSRFVIVLKSEICRHISLRIKVNEKHPFSRKLKSSAKIHRCCGFAYSAFLIGDSYDLHYSSSSSSYASIAIHDL